MQDQQEFWKLLEDFDTAMVVTRDGDTLRARPMAPKLSKGRNEILFITDLESHKVDEIQSDNRVAVSFTRHGEYVSVSGRGRVSTDKALIDEAWDAEAEAWMPQGKDGPGVAILVVEPVKAETWDIKTSKIRQAYEFAKAFVGGKDRPDVGENRKIDL